MDITTFEPMLKKYYAEGRVPLRAYEGAPTLKLLTKDENWTGENHEMPIWVETGQAVGHDFATALAGKASAGEGVFKRWSLSESKIYGFAKLNRLVMLRSRNDARAFLSHYTEKVDGTLGLLGRELAAKIFRKRRMDRGTVATGGIGNGSGTNDKVTLSRREDIVNFSVGMRLTFTDTSNSNALIVFASSGNPVVSKINRSAGTFEVTNGVGGASLNLADAPGTVDAAIVATDLIFRRGDALTASDTLGFAGFDDWIPATAPSATTFMGVDRTSDLDKLSGIRVSGVGLTMEESLYEASQRAFESSADLTHWVCNPFRFGQLMKEMGSKMVRDPEESQRLGTSVFRISTNAGEQRLYADRYCQKDVLWGLDIKTWKLVSTKSLPHIFDDDFRMLREASSDDYEVRMGGYGQLGCHYPGGNVRIDLV